MKFLKSDFRIRIKRRKNLTKLLDAASMFLRILLPLVGVVADLESRKGMRPGLAVPAVVVRIRRYGVRPGK